MRPIAILAVIGTAGLAPLIAAAVSTNASPVTVTNGATNPVPTTVNNAAANPVPTTAQPTPTRVIYSGSTSTFSQANVDVTNCSALRITAGVDKDTIGSIDVSDQPDPNSSFVALFRASFDATNPATTAYVPLPGTSNITVNLAASSGAVYVRIYCR